MKTSTLLEVISLAATVVSLLPEEQEILHDGIKAVSKADTATEKTAAVIDLLEKIVAEMRKVITA